jgi:hypothetical protein
MVARSAMVARVGTRQRALVVAKNWLDGGVDIEMEKRASPGLHWRKAVFGHHLLEIGDGLVVEAPQVSVLSLSGKGEGDFGGRCSGSMRGARQGSENLERPSCEEVIVSRRHFSRATANSRNVRDVCCRSKTDGHRVSRPEHRL